MTPTQAIAGVLNLAAGQLEFATIKVGELDDDQLMDENGHMHPWINFQRDVMNRISSYAASATAMGLDAKLSALAEAQTRMITELIERVMDDLDLTPDQRKKLGPAIRSNMTLVEGKAKERA